jgi:hypothetical protein
MLPQRRTTAFRSNTRAGSRAIRSIAKSGYAEIEAYRQAVAEAVQFSKNSAVTGE